MQLFAEGGLKDEGGMIDEVSGNEVPIGGTKEGVRDDIPANVSEGEFIMPADVVRYHGLDKMMQIRQEAKMGLKQMEAMGQMGNSDEATMDDDMPFGMADLVVVGGTGEPMEFADGGFVPSYAPGGTVTLNTAAVPTTDNTQTEDIDYSAYMDSVTTVVKEYRNAAGETIAITFINGEPTIPVPEGYSLYTPVAGEVATAPSPAGSVAAVYNSGNTNNNNDRDGNTPSSTGQIAGYRDPNAAAATEVVDYRGMSDTEFAARMEMENGKGYQFGKVLGYAIASMVPGGVTLMYGASRQHARRSEERLNTMIGSTSGAVQARYIAILDKVLDNARLKPTDKTNVLVKAVDGLLINKGYTSKVAKDAATEAASVLTTGAEDISPAIVQPTGTSNTSSYSDELGGPLFEGSPAIMDNTTGSLGAASGVLPSGEEAGLRVIDSGSYLANYIPEPYVDNGVQIASLTDDELVNASTVRNVNTLPLPQTDTQGVNRSLPNSSNETAAQGLGSLYSGSVNMRAAGLGPNAREGAFNSANTDFGAFYDSSYKTERDRLANEYYTTGAGRDGAQISFGANPLAPKYAANEMSGLDNLTNELADSEASRTSASLIRRQKEIDANESRARINANNAASATAYRNSEADRISAETADLIAKAESQQRKYANEAANRQMTEAFSYTPPAATTVDFGIDGGQDFGIGAGQDFGFDKNPTGAYVPKYPGDDEYQQKLRDRDNPPPIDVTSVNKSTVSTGPLARPSQGSLNVDNDSPVVRAGKIDAANIAANNVQTNVPVLGNSPFDNVPRYNPDSLQAAAERAQGNYVPAPVVEAPKTAIDGPFAGFPEAPSANTGASQAQLTAEDRMRQSQVGGLPKQTTNVSTQGQIPPIQMVADPRTNLAGTGVDAQMTAAIPPQSLPLNYANIPTGGSDRFGSLDPINTPPTINPQRSVGEAGRGGPEITESELTVKPSTVQPKVRPTARPTPNTPYQDFANRFTDDRREYVNNVLVDKDGNRVNNFYQSAANFLTPFDDEEYKDGVLGATDRSSSSRSKAAIQKDINAKIKAATNSSGEVTWTPEINALVKKRDGSSTERKIGTVNGVPDRIIGADYSREDANRALGGNSTNPLTKSANYPQTKTNPGGYENNQSDENGPKDKAIVCTEMYRQTELADWQQAMKIWHVYQERYLTIHHQVGYHWLFQPYVKGMKNSSILTKLGSALAKHRTQHLRYVLTKGKAKDDLLGNIWCKFIHPIVYVAGIIKEKVGK